MSMSWHKQSSDKSPCVECRKRRIRCQRPFPCQNCVKQGLADACIQGSVVKGTRSLKASSIILHEDLAKMSVREQKLEEALAEAQSSISVEPHPLLVRDSQIRMASPVPGLQRAAKAGVVDAPQAPDNGIGEVVASLGMMSLNEKSYHGETVASEYIQEHDEADVQEPVSDIPSKRRPPPPLHLPPELILLSVQFPFPPSDQRTLSMDAFLKFLPPYERAQQLLDMYYSYYAWCTIISPSSGTLEDVFYPFYPDGEKVDSLQLVDAHRLAVLFMIFVLGTLYDLSLDIERMSADAEVFHILARAAVASHDIADHPSVHGVQAVVLMIWYFRLFPGRRSHSYQWVLSGVLTRIVQSLGLHRDCSLSVPDPILRMTAEQTFWEYNCLDIWQSFMFGRPTSMVSSVIDCKRPLRVDVTPGQNPDFFPWKYSFTQLVSDVLLQSTHASTYGDILKYERTLKAHPKPSSLAWPPRGSPFPIEAVGRTFQRYLAVVWENASVMYLHRRLLVDMLQKYRDSDPTISPHWRSALVAYESARALVYDMRRLRLAYPRYIDRMAPFWSHTTTAGLLLGTLVAYVPGADFAEDALQHLDDTCEMFEEAKQSLQPPICLPALRKSQRQARYAFSKLHDPMALSNMKTDDIDMSPAEAHFPFTFGDSPPRTTDQSQHISGFTGGVIQPSAGMEAQLIAYKTVNGVVRHGSALISPMPQSSNGYSVQNGTKPHPRSAWGQVISQMVM